MYSSTNSHRIGIKITVSIILLLFVVFLGTMAYMYLEGWSFYDSLYMTIITMSTVGFREVQPLDPQGRILTVLVIFSGLTIATYALSTITSYFVGGLVTISFRRARMEHKIQRLKDHVILAGYGKLGRPIATGLKEAGAPFCIIESDPQRSEEAIEKGLLTLVGDASDEEILKKSGIQNAKGLVAALSGDAANVIVTITARTLNPDLRIVARGTDENSETILKRAGADRVELPFYVGGRRLTQMILRPSLVDFVDLFMDKYGHKMSIEEFPVPEKSPLHGNTISKTDFRRKSGGAMIMAIKRQSGDVVLHPTGDEPLKQGDTILVLADINQIKILKREFRLE